MITSPDCKAIMVILDGYGVSTSSKLNAVEKANTPCLKHFFSRPHHQSILKASGEAVGLPKGQIGNSEVGHLHLGAGRICLQGLSLIDEKLKTHQLDAHHLFSEKIEEVIRNERCLHILGLLSPGGVHSHEDHIIRIAQWAAEKGIKKIYIHAILDGRDVPPQSAETSLEKINQLKIHLANSTPCTLETASIIGRFYTMDRDHRWERIEKGYRLFTQSLGDFSYSSATEALKEAYLRHETDEFISATWCLPFKAPISKDDLILVANFRADRARQITQALTQDDFSYFQRSLLFQNLFTLTEYDPSLKSYAIFPQEIVKNSLAEVLSQSQKRQLHIGETEKFAHVTFFFNGNRHAAFEGEDRILIPSDRSVPTYDQNPKMQAQAITNAVENAIVHQCYDFILINYANADMVGHTGNFDATVCALEYLDSMLKRIIDLAQKHHFELFITADHGNAEEMFHAELNQKNTQHTNNPVPLFYLGKRFSALEPSGALVDVAPTVLDCLDLPIPKEMSGKSLGVK